MSVEVGPAGRVPASSSCSASMSAHALPMVWLVLEHFSSSAQEASSRAFVEVSHMRCRQTASVQCFDGGRRQYIQA